MAEPDYYEILQVSPRAEPEVIDAAYRRLARRYHPDVNPSAAAQQRMRELNRAREMLSDSRRRRDYDSRRQRLLAERVMATKPTTFAFPTPPPEEHARGVLERLRRVPVWQALAGGVGIALAVLAVIALFASDLGGGDESNGAPSEATPPAESAATGGEPAEESATFSDGTWLVGEEIPPGTWRAIRPRTCSWKRLASIEGATDLIASSGSYLTVEIQPLDAAFSTEGCGWWTQILTPPSATPTDPFGPGTWLVPEEIALGTWQNSDSSEGCAWTMLAELSGEPSAVIASGVTDAPATMEITGGERAFDSQGCGTWTRVSE